MASRNNRRDFRIRITPPVPARRFQNFIILYGVHHLADNISVHTSTVQSWKAGRKFPSPLNLCKLLRFSEGLLSRAVPPVDVFGDGRPLVFEDIVHSETKEFGERAKR